MCLCVTRRTVVGHDLKGKLKFTCCIFTHLPVKDMSVVGSLSLLSLCAAIRRLLIGTVIVTDCPL